MKNIYLGLVVLSIVIAGAYFISKNNNVEQQANLSELPKETQEDIKQMQEEQKEETTNKELQTEILQEGTGQEAKNGDTLSMHYTGTLENGTKFDSSLDRGQPFSFQLGVGQVIQGWDLGVLGMKVGEKRKLIIPPHLGYGNRDLGSIPPNSTLIFEVELMKIN